MSAKSLILLVGFLTEGVLSLLWFLAYFFDFITPASKPYSLDVFLCIVLFLVIPLLLLNYLLFIFFPNQNRKDFVTTKVYPLCQVLNIPLALAISVMAGIGEELFFRDLLLNILSDNCGLIIGVLASSFAFASIHFIGHFKNSRELILIYTLVGVYFSLVYLVTNSVLVCVAIHALYDFVAILVYKYFTPKKIINYE